MKYSELSPNDQISVVALRNSINADRRLAASLPQCPELAAIHSALADAEATAIKYISQDAPKPVTSASGVPVPPPPSSN